jgi:hypothetical protein
MHAKPDTEDIFFMPRGELAYVNGDRNREGSSRAVLVSECDAGAATLPQRHCGVAGSSQEDLLLSMVGAERQRSFAARKRDVTAIGERSWGADDTATVWHYASRLHSLSSFGMSA